jgi:SPP1 gp7 family putative phage head morphogenesis protein
MGKLALKIISVNVFDPTWTLGLRNQFAREMAKRFARLRGVIRRAIVEEDAFGLMAGGDNLFFLRNAIPAEDLIPPGRRAFDFPTSSAKVEGFMEWLRQQSDKGILELRTIPQIGAGIEAAWTNKFIENAFKRGINRARIQLRSAGYDVPSISESGGIDVVFNHPLHLDRAGLLYTRTFNDLKGITAAMDQQLSRLLAQGIADGLNPREIARQLTKTIKGPIGGLGITDTLGRFIPAERRARLLARTEVIRAHAEAQLQEFKNWGVEGVTVKAEFRTAGDDRVCAVCQSLEGKVYSLKEASGVIPVHPDCRCMFVPKDVTSERRGGRR